MDFLLVVLRCATLSGMARRKGTPPAVRNDGKNQPISLKGLAAHLGLSPATVSIVINRTRTSDTIPEDTKRRIMDAARELNYRPNIIARSLRQQRTYSVGVLVPELSDGYSSLVLSGIEDCLFRNGYALLTAGHRHKKELIAEYPKLFFDRAVEGLITIDTPYNDNLPFPVVSVSGHDRMDGVTNIELNHDTAAELALAHLLELGHRRIAFIKGQSFSSDTEIRWESIRRAAKRLGVAIRAELVEQLQGDSPSPEVGYSAMAALLARARDFTALFSFNDVSAIGAIRALHDAGLRVPEEISVVGFDDIYGAAFHTPALTTIRQPLVKMGLLAAETLLSRIARTGETVPALQVEPELVVRESSGPVAKEQLQATKV
jgi:DNA-binding LacI/PurR family transcriptional regulator